MWGILTREQLSASPEAFLSFHFGVKQHNHHTTYREVLTGSQRITESCIAVRSSAAVTGWPADGGFLCDRVQVCGDRIKGTMYHVGLYIRFKWQRVRVRVDGRGVVNLMDFNCTANGSYILQKSLKI